MGGNTEEALVDFQQKIGYFFQDINLLQHALRHGSSTALKGDNNERLEFFGDAILDFIVCEELFKRCESSDEGVMTDIKGEVVSRKVIGRVLASYNIRSIMSLGKGISSNKELPVSLYANMFEAIVAAIYLDSSIVEVSEVVLRLLNAEIDIAIKNTKHQNFKSLVQEIVQKYRLGDIIYTIIDATGPEHERVFTVELALNGMVLGTGKGRNRKEAEQLAAEVAFSSELLSEQLTPEE